MAGCGSVSTRPSPIRGRAEPARDVFKRLRNHHAGRLPKPDEATTTSAFALRRKPTCSDFYRYIAARSRLDDVAGGYIDRIEATCLALETFPKRGTARDDIRPGLRTMGFEHPRHDRPSGAEIDVVIVRIFYGGQDYERALRGTAND